MRYYSVELPSVIELLALLILSASATVAPPASGDDQARNLGAERYAEREAALNLLWQEGLESEDLLRDYAKSDDPEVAWRARRILQMIELRLAPDTSPRILALVESFLQASSKAARDAAFEELLKLEAYPQLVRLPRQLSNSQTRSLYERRVDKLVAGLAAELILEKKDEEALTLLSEARDSPAGNLRYIALASAMGLREQLDPELTEADRMRFARWAGDLDAVRELAPSDHEVHTTLQIIDGNPIPFLEGRARVRGPEGHWARMAIGFWTGESDEKEMQKLVGQASRLRGSDEPTGFGTDDPETIELLASFGPAEEIFPVFAKIRPHKAFTYHHSHDHTDQALASYGLVAGEEADPEWIAQNLALIGEQWSLDNVGCLRLIQVAYSLYENGQLAKSEVILRALRDHIAKMDDAEQLVSYLTFLAGNAERVEGVANAPTFSTGFPELALVLAQEEGGELFEPAEFLRLTFGARESIFSLFAFLRENYPDDDEWKLVRMIYASYGLEVSISREEVDTYLDAFEKMVEKENQVEGWNIMRETAVYLGDIARLERALKAKVALDDERLNYKSALATFYFANHRYAETAKLWLEIQEASPSALSYGGYAYLAVSQVMSGEAEAAAESFAMLEKLSLGDGQWLATLAKLWAECGEFEKAYQCELRALLMLPSTGNTWSARLYSLGMAARQVQRWQTFAAAAQVGQVIGTRQFTMNVGEALQMRAQVDYTLAMAAFEEGRTEEGRRRLEQSAIIGGQDGFFANEPLWELRKASRFEEVRDLWDRIGAVYRRAIEINPNADNTLNTAAWSAARAGVDLDQAMIWVDRALELRPHVSAYLDTKAEVYFAQGNREQALIWSERACELSRNTDELAQLRLQQSHFRNDDFYLVPNKSEEPAEDESNEEELSGELRE